MPIQFRILWPAFCATVLVFTTTACGDKSKAAGPPAFPPSLVSVIEVQSEDVPVLAEYPAQTFARDTVEIRGRVDGYIQKRLFEVGRDVTAGQILYELDARPYQADVAKAKGDLEKSLADLKFAQEQVAVRQAEADLAQAQANLIKAKQDVTRLEPLVKQEAAPQQDLDNARAALDANQATVDAKKATLEQTKLQVKSQIATSSAQVEANRALLRTAELNVEYSTVRSPISGRIGDSLVQVGGLVSKTSATPLTTVVPLDPIWVRFKVSESEYLAYLRKAGRDAMQKTALTMVLADGTEHPVKGHVQNTVNAVDSKTGTLEIQATFGNPSHNLLPGQFGRIRYVTDERHNAVVIPQRAVQELQGSQSVFLVDAQNKAQLQPVVPAERVGSRWIITQGLKPGDKVIVEGLLKVRPGAPVNPMPWKPEPTGK